MATRTVDFEKLGTLVLRETFEEEIELPGITELVSVTTEPELERGSVEYDLNEEMLSVKLSNVKSTSSRYVSLQGNLIESDSSGPGNLVRCIYRAYDSYGNPAEGITEINTGNQFDCPYTEYISVKLHDYKYRIIIEYKTLTKSGEVMIKTKEVALSLPVFDLEGVDDNSLRTSIDEKVVCFNLVDTNNESASAVRVMTNNGIKAIAKE